MTTSERIREYAIITAGTFVIAAAVFFFLAPSRLAVGSASGLAVVLSHFIPLSLSVITFGLNALFLLLGFFNAGVLLMNLVTKYFGTSRKIKEGK